MTLPVGTVIKYNSYPHPEDGEIKPYWFLVMGRTSLLIEPQYYFMFKTTARLNYYLDGGTRQNNPSKILYQSTYNFFEEDCCIDFNLPVFDRHTVSEIQSLISSGRVEVKGRLDSILSELYHLAIKGKGAPQKIKEHFYGTFNTDGITGLKKPQGHDKNFYRSKYK